MPGDPALEIDVATTKKLLDAGEISLLLDCRNPDEFETVRIIGSTLIPMREIGVRLTELETYRDQSVVVHCHHGGRSRKVTEFLIAQGFSNVKNMTGGIDEWSVQIDPSLPRY